MAEKIKSRSRVGAVAVAAAVALAAVSSEAEGWHYHAAGRRYLRPEVAARFEMRSFGGRIRDRDDVAFPGGGFGGFGCGGISVGFGGDNWSIGIGVPVTAVPAGPVYSGYSYGYGAYNPYAQGGEIPAFSITRWNFAGGTVVWPRLGGVEATCGSYMQFRYIDNMLHRLGPAYMLRRGFVFTEQQPMVQAQQPPVTQQYNYTQNVPQPAGGGVQNAAQGTRNVAPMHARDVTRRNFNPNVPIDWPKANLPAERFDTYQQFEQRNRQILREYWREHNSSQATAPYNGYGHEGAAGKTKPEETNTLLRVEKDAGLVALGLWGGAAIAYALLRRKKRRRASRRKSNRVPPVMQPGS